MARFFIYPRPLHAQLVVVLLVSYRLDLVVLGSLHSFVCLRCNSGQALVKVALRTSFRGTSEGIGQMVH